MSRDKCHDDDCHGARGTRDHSRATAADGRNQSDEEGRVKPNQGRESRDKRESDRLGYERKRHGHAGEQVVLQGYILVAKEIQHIVLA